MENDQPSPANRQIVDALAGKSNLKSFVYDKTLDIFAGLKELMAEISNDLDEALDEVRDSGRPLSKRVKLEYRDRGKDVAELRFADDVLVFSMCADIFQFDRNHPVWNVPYAKESVGNTYCGVINVYNFLYESIKLNRQGDLGYLVARMFVNRDGYFFVEGKNQTRNRVEDFGKVLLDKKELRSFVEGAMLYALSFDLLVPPFDVVKTVTVGEKNSEDYVIKTAKRLGFDYRSDDVLF